MRLSPLLGTRERFGFKVSQMVGRLCSLRRRPLSDAGRVRRFLLPGVQSPRRLQKIRPRETSRTAQPAARLSRNRSGHRRIQTAERRPSKSDDAGSTADKGTVPSETGAALRRRGRPSFQRRIAAARHSVAGGRDRASFPPANTPIGDTTVDDLRADVTKAIDSGDDQALQAALGKVTGNFGKRRPGDPRREISPGSDVGVFSLSTRDRARGPLLRVGGTPPASADRPRPAARCAATSATARCGPFDRRPRSGSCGGPANAISG